MTRDSCISQGVAIEITKSLKSTKKFRGLLCVSDLVAVILPTRYKVLLFVISTFWAEGLESQNDDFKREKRIAVAAAFTIFDP